MAYFPIYWQEPTMAQADGGDDERQESFSDASEILSFFGYFTRTRARGTAGAWAARARGWAKVHQVLLTQRAG